MKITRRSLLAAPAFLTLTPAMAQMTTSHGLSVFDDLKYPANFTHYDYVNPNAPKGGTFNYQPPSWLFNQNPETFNSFNTFILKGDAPQGLEGIYASLFESTGDEAGTAYGFVAESVTYDAAKLTYIFKLRDNVFFHDGTPITADDVVFTYTIMKDQGHPQIRQYMRNVTGIEKLSNREVKITLSPERSRDLIMLVATKPILSKAYYSTRSFSETTMDLPLGSSAYKVGKFEQGRFIEYERVKNWWGENLPTQKGKNNFDTIRIDIFKDRDVAFEAFKAKQIHFREEFTSRLWAVAYEFPAVKEGKIKREGLRNERPSGGQGWHMNTRRDKFKNPLVREALIYAFDFEWVQKNLQYNLLQRTHSFFQGTDMEAKGELEGAELALLEPFRAKLSPRVFGEVIMSPLSDGTGQDRANLRKAAALLKEAGLELKDSVLYFNKEPFTIEFLDASRALLPHTESFVRSLKRLGIEANIRTVDPSQYQERIKNFDYDIVSSNSSTTLAPGGELKFVFGSESVNQIGTMNRAGIADPVVDLLIEKAIKAESRQELYTIIRAIDRVLRASFYRIHHWNRAEHLIAYWDMFERPAKKPRYSLGAPDTWWAKI